MPAGSGERNGGGGGEEKRGDVQGGKFSIYVELRMHLAVIASALVGFQRKMNCSISENFLIS